MFGKLLSRLNTHFCDVCHVADVSISKVTCILIYTRLLLDQSDCIPRPLQKEVETVQVFVRLCVNKAVLYCECKMLVNFNLQVLLCHPASLMNVSMLLHLYNYVSLLCEC